MCRLIAAPLAVNWVSAVAGKAWPTLPLKVTSPKPATIAKLCAPLMVELKETSPDPSVTFAAVLIVTPAPKVAGPVTVTLLPVVLSVVILPLSVTPPAPVKATVLIPLAVCVPIAPTVTVPPVALRVTSSDVVPSILSALIAPPVLLTVKFAPSRNLISAVLKAIASAVELKVGDAPVMMMF